MFIENHPEADRDASERWERQRNDDETWVILGESENY